MTTMFAHCIATKYHLMVDRDSPEMKLHQRVAFWDDAIIAIRDNYDLL